MGFLDLIGMSPTQALQQQVASEGSSPPPQTAPAPAVPATGPSDSGGGVGSIFNGIGGAISGAMDNYNNGGMFSSADDDKVDPATGVPKGVMARVNNQSMFKLGLMLIAAGQPQSAESRAKILSGLGNAVGDSNEQINSFAKSRLEMAKFKLVQRQALQEEAASANINKVFGGMGTMAPVSPGMRAVEATQATVGAPGGVPAVVAGGTGTDTLAGGSGVGSPDPATTGTTAPAPDGAPLPISPSVQPVRPVVSNKPLPPDRFPTLQDVWTPADKAAIMISPTTAAKSDYIRKRTQDLANMEIQGKPYINQQTGQQEVGVYKGGVLIGTKSLGQLEQDIVDKTDPRTGDVTRDTVRGGHVVARTDVRDPAAARRDEAESQMIRADRKDLVDAYHSDIRPRLDSIDRLDKFRQIVKEGNLIAGTAADTRINIANALATAGVLDKGKIQQLINSKQLEAELAKGAGEFAKKYEGPNVSNFDMQNAQRIMGASLNNDPAVLGASIERLRSDHVSSVKQYNERASRHNTSLPEEYTGTLRSRSTVPTVDRNFDGVPDAQQKQGGGPTPEQIKAAAQAQLKKLGL